MTPVNQAEAAKPRYTRDDFVSGQQVRWCPGCGDYSILASMQRTLTKFDIPRERYVFISGIGCSSRFPYYMNAYGFHTIHGRAPTIATGLKCANPELVVWVITGDGDGLSIGGNHLIHCMRRNVNLNIVLVNNRIYGLTKGQYSPTSERGKVTKSTPWGSIDHPINPLCIAIASEATFIARTLDSDPKHMAQVFERAMQHKGTSFIEVYQNCNIFNDKAFVSVTGRDVRAEKLVYLEDGKPLVFGAKRDKAVRVKRLQTSVVNIEEAKRDNVELIVHRENDPEPNYAYLLTQMEYPDMPVPFGIFRAFEKPTYDDELRVQNEQAVKQLGKGSLKELIYGNETWTVKEGTEVKKKAPAKVKTKDEHEAIPGEDQGEISIKAIITPVNGQQKRDREIQKVRMTAPISEIITTKDLLKVSKKENIRNVILLLQEKDQDCVIVMEGKKLLGILSYRDISSKIAGIHKDLTKALVGEFMTSNPEYVQSDSPIAFAVNKMSVGGFRHLPVLEADGTPVSIITIRDVLLYLDKRD